MSSHPQHGEIVFECLDDCKEEQHILVEVDYEWGVSIWGTVYSDHATYSDTILPLLRQYVEDIDDESSFYIFGGRPVLTVEQQRQALHDDIEAFILADREPG